MKLLSKFKKYYISILILVLACFSVTTYTDELASSYLNNSLTRALTAFAIVRGLNSVISVVQSTQIAMEPAGIGVSVSLGEVLDPINDLIEWLSNIMLTSIAAIGFQKLLLEVISYSTFRFIFSGVLLIYAVARIYKKNEIFNSHLSKRILVLVLFLRFGFPLIGLANDYIFKNIITQKYEASIAQVEQLNNNISQLPQQIDESDPNQTSWYSKIYNNLISATNELNLKAKITTIKDLFSKTGKELTDLAVIFIFDAIILPLLFFLILSFLVKRI